MVQKDYTVLKNDLRFPVCKAQTVHFAVSLVMLPLFPPFLW